LICPTEFEYDRPTDLIEFDSERDWLNYAIRGPAYASKQD